MSLLLRLAGLGPAGAGRPRLAAETESVYIRLTAGDLLRLDRARGYEPRSAWCRRQLLAALSAPPPAPRKEAPAEERLTKRILVHLARRDYDRAERARGGEELSPWCRRVLLAALPEPRGLPRTA